MSTISQTPNLNEVREALLPSSHELPIGTFSTLTRPSITLRDGTNLFVREWGDGETLLFLAGWGLPSDMWFQQMAPLSAEGFRCVAYDRRGHGRSSDPGCGYDFDTLATDLHEVIEQLALRNVTVVTHSMAACEIVRYLTLFGSEKIRGVILIAAGGIPYMVKTDDNPNGIDPSALRHFHEHDILGNFPQWLDDNEKPYFAPEYPVAMCNYTKAMMLRGSLQALHGCQVSACFTDFRTELAQLSIPVLMLHGELDASTPLNLNAIPASRLIPGARLKIYQQAAHGMYYTHRAEINEDIKVFCKRE
jgi:non-heme chloroperoxidase